VDLHARLVAASTDDVGLVIDRRWRDTYVGRALHPISEAELASVIDGPGGPRVDRVGKTVVPADEAVGEFIGLARFSAAGARAVRGVWTRARQGEGGLEAPFGRAARLRQAYLSDALNALADGGTRLAPLFIEKGSVTLDGVSLTVNTVGEDRFSVQLIPETQARTTLADRAVGERYNVEADVIGKYVARLHAAHAPRPAGSGGLTVDMLRAAGFGLD